MKKLKVGRKKSLFRGRKLKQIADTIDCDAVLYMLSTVNKTYQWIDEQN